MTTRHLSRVLGAVTLGSWCATELLAWQSGWSAALGVPLGHWGPIPLYSPWAGWIWAWQWSWSTPSAFLRAGLVCVGVTGLCCLRLAPTRGQKPGQARWATRGDLRRAGLMGRHGIVLGKAYGRILTYSGDAHTLMVAPSGSGKSTTLGIPTALTWRHSFFAHDPKGELYPLSAGWRGRFSTVIRLDPTSPTSQCYNPLSAIRLQTAHEIRDTALLTEILVNPDGLPAEQATAQHFRELTTDLCIGIVLHGLYTRQATTLQELDAFFTSEADLEQVFAEMRTTAHTREGVHPAVRRGVNVVQRLADRELSGVLSTASRALRLTLDPLVARMTSTSDFVLRDLRERARPMSLYLTVPYSDQDRLRPLSRLIVRQVLDYTTQHLGGWRWRLLGLIDEVQALNHMPTIASALNFVRGYGVNLCLITPSLHELDRLYGVHHNFVEGAHIRVVFAPNDPGIADTFSRMTGMVEVEKARESVSHHPWHLFQGHATRSTSVEEERLLSPTALTFLPEDEALLLVGNGGYPARIKKVRYFERRIWRQRSEVQP